MIEIEHFTSPGVSEARSAILVNTENIATIEPLVGTGARCQILLKNGRQLVVPLGYAELRRLFVEARSGLATALTEEAP